LRDDFSVVRRRVSKEGIPRRSDGEGSCSANKDLCRALVGSIAERKSRGKGKSLEIKTNPLEIIRSKEGKKLAKSVWGGGKRCEAEGENK